MVQELNPLSKTLVPFNDIVHTAALTIPPQKKISNVVKRTLGGNDRFGIRKALNLSKAELEPRPQQTPVHSEDHTLIKTVK